MSTPFRDLGARDESPERDASAADAKTVRKMHAGPAISAAVALVVLALVIDALVLLAAWDGRSKVSRASLHEALGLTPLSIALLAAPILLAAIGPVVWSRWRRHRALMVDVLSDEGACGHSEPSAKP